MSQNYVSEAQFEALFTRMFDRIETDDPDGMDELVEQKMVIRFRLREPDVELWIDGRTKPVQTSFGTQKLDATLTADLTANSMHELLLGTLPLGRAILPQPESSRVEVQGNEAGELAAHHAGRLPRRQPQMVSVSGASSWIR